MLLQSFVIHNDPYDKKHIQYKITIPKNISNVFDLKNGQTVYLKDNGKIIYIHMFNEEGSIPITVSKNCTLIRNNIKYFIIRICIPIPIIENCKLKKRDEFWFESTKNTITMHKIPT